MDTLKKVLICFVVLGMTSCCYNTVSLCECDFLEAWFQAREQGWSTSFFVGREVVDNMMLEIWEGHCKKELWTKTGMVGCNAYRVLLSVGSDRDFYAVRLLQPILNVAVRQTISIKRGPVVTTQTGVKQWS